MELPAVRGYDRAFAVRHGVFPPIRPAAHRALATVALPLTTASHSFHLARQLVRQGNWPTPSQVRTEEFLAAMDCQLPPAQPGEVAIRTAAGPSLFGPTGTGLLQIAAVTGDLPGRDDRASHLVLAIDMSRSMARGQRLDLVQSAAHRLLRHLRPHDRLSLVVFDEDLRHVIEGATAAEESRLRRLLADLSPAGGTDLAQGLQQAAAVGLAEQSGDEKATRIVLITDSHVAMPLATESLVTEVLKTAAAGGVQLAVLDVGDQPETDRTLERWAEMMGGQLYRPESIDEAGWLLVEALYDQTPVVATEVKMTVRFRPQVVAAYRLIGHEANAMGSLHPAEQTTELRVGEAATTLFEIWFQPNDEDDVGEVELSWRDASGREQRRQQRISRIQFAPTWEQSPLSLQQAAIAAQTAEVLRGSRATLRELNLVPQEKENFERLLATAERIHPRLADRPQFQDFMSFVRQLSGGRGR
jgi:Ca-activated chloride channel family protein